jgi:TusA-related sulfurtransferase
VDLREVECPEGYVLVLAHLNERDEGDVVEFQLAGGATIADLPYFLRVGGHELLKVRPLGGGKFAFVVRRGPEKSHGA